MESGGTTRSFLAIQLTIAFVAAIFLNPVRMHSYDWNLPLLALGLSAGIVFGLMMIAIGKALEKGPPGLTFAAVSGSTVLPGLLMAILFGAAFGYEYRLWHAIGSLLVLAGLFWAGWGLAGFREMKRWLFFCTAAFGLHVLLLVLMQWRSLMMHLDSSSLGHLLSSKEAASSWFMPMMYLAAALIQVAVFLKHEKRMPQISEWKYGFFGGAANALSTFFVIRATETASGLENAMIFPIFSVMVLLLCNAWGQKLYKEKVNWKAAQVCTLGLLIGTMDWKVLLSRIF